VVGWQAERLERADKRRTIADQKTKRQMGAVSGAAGAATSLEN